MSDVKDAVRFEEEDYDINQELYNVYAARSANKSAEDLEKELFVNTADSCLALSGLIMKTANKGSYDKDTLYKAIAEAQNRLLELQYHFIGAIDEIDKYMWEDANEAKSEILSGNSKI